MLSNVRQFSLFSLGLIKCNFHATVVSVSSDVGDNVVEGFSYISDYEVM